MNNLALIAIASLSGLGLGYAATPLGSPAVTVIIYSFVCSFLMGTVVFGLRRIMHLFVESLPFGKSIILEYDKRDYLAHSSLILTLTSFFGVRISIPTLEILLIAYLSSHLLLVLYLVFKSEDIDQRETSQSWLLVMFLVSGFAALIYQVCWQRVLFKAYGVNIESITIIVSLFMFGLGIGSLFGGFLSKKFPNKLPQLFFICEVAIGLFGFFSLPLIKWVSNAVVVDGGPLYISLSIYALLSIPTMFMGATLPILVTYLHQSSQNIGKSMGILYAINTIGSGIASIITVDILFKFMGVTSAVYVAATCNILVGVGVYLYMNRLKSEPTSEQIDSQELPFPENYSLSTPVALGLSAIVGFISLSQEMLWTRTISYATASLPQVFGQVLGFFLFGIAFGSLFARFLCKKNYFHPYILIALFVGGGSFSYWLSLPLITFLITKVTSLALFSSYIFVAFIAFLFGGILTIISHYSLSKKKNVGQGLSWIYLANIIGSTAGPLITGFILLDHFTLEELLRIFTIFGLFLCFLLLLFSPSKSSMVKGSIVTSIILMSLLPFIHNPIYENMLKKMLGKKYHHGLTLKSVIQNRSGIITVTSKDGLDTTYGGGAYDGTIHWDPPGFLSKPQYSVLYNVAKYHKDPKELLFIGMSSGTGGKLLAEYEKLESLELIDINPGYVELIKQYPRADLILDNPKVQIHLDDGRRWLVRNPTRKFDIIVNATSHHFRSHMTNINSVEFFKLCKKHLKPNGILFFHTTNSADVSVTISKVFKYIVEDQGYTIAADYPFVLPFEEAAENYKHFVHNGEPIFNKFQEEYLQLNRKDVKYLNSWPGAKVITDDNMLGEFKHGKGWISNFYYMYDKRKSLF